MAEAVTTSVSSFTSARAGNANDTTDADNPARIKGFNLNIPNLHEVYNQTNNKVLLTRAGGLPLCRRHARAVFSSMWLVARCQSVQAAETGVASSVMGENDKDNDYDYQYNYEEL
ncbi:hypothetical protein OVX87_08895 [Klebsiella pneumoniae]|nr:hypothetical protein [Klebsiella pneumoniae]